MMKDQGRVARLRMPFGRYRDDTIATVWLDTSYCEWLLGQDWFKRLYASHYVAILLRPSSYDVARIAEMNDAAERSRFEAVQQSRRDHETAERAKLIEKERRRMDGVEAKMSHPGVMPFGKYKGQPLNVVVRDRRYMAHLRGTHAYYHRELGLDYYPNTLAQLRDLQTTIVPFPTKSRRRVEAHSL
jgi:uncharacterized protein (DUF3820 family)